FMGPFPPCVGRSGWGEARSSASNKIRRSRRRRSRAAAEHIVAETVHAESIAAVAVHSTTPTHALPVIGGAAVEVKRAWIGYAAMDDGAVSGAAKLAGLAVVVGAASGNALAHRRTRACFRWCRATYGWRIETSALIITRAFRVDRVARPTTHELAGCQTSLRAQAVLTAATSLRQDLGPAAGQEAERLLAHIGARENSVAARRVE